MAKALITGCTGQDGSYLVELLLSKGYEVHGLIRRSSNYSLPNLVNVKDKITIHYGDLENTNHLHNLIYRIQPDELYNLASQSDVGISFNCPEYTGDITGLAICRILEAVRTVSPKTKLYQASTSELFGNSPAPQNENTPMLPQSPYAIAKLYAHNMVRLYRESYGLFACSGILFNHESPRRGLNFVTRKITNTVAKIVYGKQAKLMLGNLYAVRDWGYAPDYVKAMWLMLQQKYPGDYVIGTGRTHSVQDFAAEAFGCVGLDWQRYTSTNLSLMRPAETNFLCADSYKAQNILGWESEVGFSELVRIMIEADLKQEKSIEHLQPA